MDNTNKKAKIQNDTLFVITTIVCFVITWFNFFTWGAKIEFPLFIITPFIMFFGVITWLIAIIRLLYNLLLNREYFRLSSIRLKCFFLIVFLILPFSGIIIPSPTATGAKYCIWKNGGMNSLYEWGMGILNQEPHAVIIDNKSDSFKRIKTELLSEQTKTIAREYPVKESPGYEVYLVQNENEKPYLLITASGSPLVGHLGVVISNPDFPAPQSDNFNLLPLSKGIYLYQSPH